MNSSDNFDRDVIVLETIKDEPLPNDEVIVLETIKKDETINLRNYAASIIDTFEDFLDTKCVNIDGNKVVLEIDNDEKEGDDSEAIIYGTEYDELINSLLVPLVELVEEARKTKYNNIDTFG